MNVSRTGRTGASRIHVLLLTLPTLFTTTVQAQDVSQAAAEYVCTAAKEKGKSRLAIFPFTDEKDEETAASAKLTTKVMGAILKCGLTVIDQTKVKHVLEEQSLGQTGLVDADTAPEIGRLTGADSLMFAALETHSMQLRLVDVLSGQVFGAGVIESPRIAESVHAESGKNPGGAEPGPNSDGSQQRPIVKKIDGEEAARSGEMIQIRQALHRLYKAHPRQFAYAVTTDREMDEFGKKKPLQQKALQNAIKRLPPVARKRLDRLRTRVLELRRSNKQFDEKVRTSRDTLKHD